MWFAFMAQDVVDSLDARKSARPAHLARLQQLLSQGRLLVAGPFPSIASNTPGPAGFTGSLIIAEFAAQEDADAWAKADPYVAAGVYADVTVKPFIKALPVA